jgi:hypothetical protein
MKFENTRVWGFEHALRGMRNAKNSWDKADSEPLFHLVQNFSEEDEKAEDYHKWMDKYNLNIKIGPNDMDLCHRLIRAGSEHRKFLRQIFVSVDITAPLYWWTEFDTYKVGTVANSTSKMHTIEKSPITINNFEIDDCEWNLKCSDDYDYNDIYTYDDIDDFKNYIVEHLEYLRKKYLETRDKKYWKELIRWLPESWLQTRTVTMNYENLLGMCSKGQRRFHKLNEWSGKDEPNLTNFINWARELPYAQDFIFIDELSVEEKKYPSVLTLLEAIAETWKREEKFDYEKLLQTIDELNKKS